LNPLRGAKACLGSVSRTGRGGRGVESFWHSNRWGNGVLFSKKGRPHNGFRGERRGGGAGAPKFDGTLPGFKKTLAAGFLIVLVARVCPCLGDPFPRPIVKPYGESPGRRGKNEARGFTRGVFPASSRVGTGHEPILDDCVWKVPRLEAVSSFVIRGFCWLNKFFKGRGGR